MSQAEAIPAAVRYHQDYGATFRVRVLGKSIFYTIDPENLRTVYDSSSEDWGVSPQRLKALQPFCGTGFITADGSAWQHSHAMLKPYLSSSNVGDHELFTSAVDHFLDLFPVDGETTDMSPKLEEFVMHDFVDYHIEMAIQNIDHEKKSILSEDHDRKIAFEHQSVLSSLIKNTKDRKEVRWQILQSMLAMSDTCSTLASNILFLLSRNPSIWKRLRHEIRGLDFDNVTVEVLTQLPLLRNILKEALRLYPVLGQYGRTALKDTILPKGGGVDGLSPIFISKGSVMISSLYALHREPTVFGSDPEIFNPDRWNSVAPAYCEYMPFGAGQRQCVGEQKAFSEVAFLVAKIASKYARIESRDAQDWTGEWRLIVKNLHGCRIAFFRT
ncbi:MAG: hypothetical protein Q9195_009063 [Heterodermia aff. obscurata]